MKSRRNFIQQGGIATLALLATKPFKTFANSTFNTSGVSLNDNTIALLHNANTKLNMILNAMISIISTSGHLPLNSSLTFELYYFVFLGLGSNG